MSEQHAPVASQATIALAEELENRLLHPLESVETRFPALAQLGVEEVLNLVFFLGAYAVSVAPKPLKVPRLAELAVSRAIAENGAVALLDWPHGFSSFLDGMVDRNRQIDAPDARLQQRYGYFYRAFQLEFNDPAYQFLHEAFEAHVRSTWKGQLARRHRNLSSETQTSHEWIPLLQAAKALGVSNKTIQRYIEQGRLVGQMYRTEAGRIFGSVSRASVADLAETRKHWLTLKAVRAHLGISRKVAESLLRNGSITPISGPSVDGATVWMFDARTLPDPRDSCLQASSTTDEKQCDGALGTMEVKSLVVFLDCEFTDFIQIDLISIGLACEDGREFYAERSDFRQEECSDFVRAAVLPLLGSDSEVRMSREVLTTRLHRWLAALPAFMIACDSIHDRDLFADALDYQPVNNLVGWINLNSLTPEEHVVFQREAARYHDLPDHPWHHALHDARAHCGGWLATKTRGCS